MVTGGEKADGPLTRRRLSEHFLRVFHEDHRALRDELLDLVEALRARDGAAVRSRLDRIAADTGPHFRYEEEALYPALVEILGPEPMEDLFGDHDRFIGVAGSLAALAARSVLSDEDAAYGIRLARSVLPHVSRCGGLAILVEALSNETVRAVLGARAYARADGLDLFDWAMRVRRRPRVATAV
ncbi:MAG TPA: hemerythrin domain-containing protein [Thermodesulfobacteriota bacterium]